ncbi:MAG: hypothetical protein AAGE96_21055 [Cyanobacteria bacterium P01_G01_bin.19]
MYKYHRLIKILLSTSTALCLTSVAVDAQNQPESQAKKTRSGSALERILSLFKSRENSLISRGDVCFVSPGSVGEQTIWSDRPLFILHDTVPQAEIDLISSTSNYNYERDGQLIWESKLPPNTNVLAYTGEKLKPGFVYDWVLSNNNKTHAPQSFKLMPQLEREAIAREIKTLKTELQQQGATAEELAIAKADYFVQQQLWSDALQQLYSVENPSPDLTNKIADLVQYLCK